MILLINGDNRIEICKIKKKDLKKMLFNHRNQLYVIVPQDLVPMQTITDKGVIREEVNLYDEGS